MMLREGGGRGRGDHAIFSSMGSWERSGRTEERQDHVLFASL